MAGETGVLLRTGLENVWCEVEGLGSGLEGDGIGKTYCNTRD